MLFFSLVAQACQLSLSKKLSLLSQLALPYNKSGSRSSSPKSSKAQNKQQVERQDSSCLDDSEQSVSLGFEPSPSLASDPPSPCVPLDIEQGTWSVGRRPVGGSPGPSKMHPLSCLPALVSTITAFPAIPPTSCFSPPNLQPVFLLMSLFFEFMALPFKAQRWRSGSSSRESWAALGLLWMMKTLWRCFEGC